MLCILALLPLGLGSGVQEDLDWHDIHLPNSRRLDLLHGIAAGEGATPAQGYLERRDGRLVASASLRALLALDPAEGSGGEQAIVRATGSHVQEAELSRGAAYLFELGASTWGYLRILDFDEQGCRLEWARAPEASESLARDPLRVEAQATPVGTILSWEADDAPEGARWRVWRSRILDPVATPRLLGEVERPRFVDVEAPRGELVEYRVARTDAVGRPLAGMGARVRAISVETPGEWPIQLEHGMRIDLLSGRTGGSRAHLEVVHPGPRTVQLRPIEGTLLSRPMPEAGSSWSVPDRAKSSYEANLRGVMVGGEIAAYLPEGVYVLIRIEGGESQGARLLRQ
jgi:hypothetical protein